MIKRFALKPLCLALGWACASPAFAVQLDFSGSNIYMKFLDGDQHIAAQGSGDTATGADQGQWTELELRFKAIISPKVEVGGRIQSRSSAAYWSEFGGFGLEGSVDNNVNKMKFMKLRGAYIQITPGYSWLNMARIGTSDWGTFDPFTVGKVRYIDRDNYNGLYFRGPVAGGSWEAARLSLPEYLQNNYGQGPVCCTTDDTRTQEAVWIGQVQVPIGPARLTGSAQFHNDQIKSTTDTNPFNGQDTSVFAENRVYMLKGEGTVADGVDLKGAFYRSTFRTDTPWNNIANPWINGPADNVNGNAFKIDAAWTPARVSGLSVAYQYFNIAEGFYSNTAARTESDVLLTEGSEAAWYGWGDPKWNGGAYSDFTQVVATPHGISGPNLAGYLGGGQNGLTDNAFKDFNEAPSESVLGWKGHTVLVNYEIFDVPLSAEYTRVDYNNNWQNNTTGPLRHFYAANQDRTTNIFAFKATHNFNVLGGVDSSFKYKWVQDKDKVSQATSADDAESKDNGVTVTLGTQLHNDLYGSVGFGHYTRDITVGSASFDNTKNIWSLKFNYSLAGFETGLLTQWINGDGDPNRDGTQDDIKQYRLKATVQAVF